MYPDDFLAAFKDELDALKPSWQSVDGKLVGPDGAAIDLVKNHESDSPAHVDVQFVLKDGDATSLRIADCVAGFGRDNAERAATAARIWASTTATALFELKYSQRGEFAEHYHSGDESGFLGWHVISGSVLGYGHGDTPQRLQDWYVSNSILPTLSVALGGSLEDAGYPYGIKVFFGGNSESEQVEVAVNGARHEAASQALADLDWPRSAETGFARSFLLVLHREER